ncbi:type I-C CRISPR-associated protein Cas8c/Csd1 [Litchfieldella qijiaojingensis]|uniref:Type I-C CRISPR-associated protein Cas8c/Csd1 n=1 Tax=Litchfieldella qijiaojingensis TaxID=980347 RepID=A0ABQ2Z3S4_9GAMM|nr:type I-C CRISPR-associated protein Cas8c/Csd1 [Halomonas qijiaojingensis]GGY02302.1 type I-C CRISPR-associated protein Cas8c/Csd1 [Halomonas qijiaojingensis]
MILTALNDYYQRLAAEDKVPMPGFSSEKVSFCLVFAQDGKPLQIVDLRDTSGKKPRPSPCQVPVDKRRTSGIHAYPLWDKTAYALGVSAGEGKRLADEHAAFKARQFELFGESDDPELNAFLRLLEQWRPDQLTELPGYSEEVLDTNVIFRLDGKHQYLHENREARRLWGTVLESGEGESGQCLITGEIAPLGTDHPAIRGVRDAQSSGASLVSFNSEAYNSYGNKGQANASISKAAIFGYSTALNHLLRGDTDNRQRLQIGDATVVFWAKARDAAHATAAENFFALLNEPPTDEQQAAKLGTLLTDIAQGRPLKELDPMLEPDTQFFVLGLAPNAARLSVRFWYVDTLEHLAQHYAHHHQDMSLEPSPWKGMMPGAWRLALQTAPIHGDRPKSEDVLPQLAGELMRSILTGSRYPRSLLNNIVMRFRNDGKISGIRVALCKAVLAREGRLAVHSNSTTQEVPVSLDPQSTHPGYLLGRLFAELENAQRSALGNEVNATIRDRYYGAASATPASVFPMLLRNVQHHLSNMRKKDKGGLAHKIETEIGTIIDGLGNSFPRSLRIEDQGRFAIGYYHQSQARFAKKDSTAKNAETEQGESE